MDSNFNNMNLSDDSFFDKQEGAFLRKVDWSAFWTCFLISLAAYVYTLAPTVTLEDSGEMVVASDYLGVPHPPGYPIWTLITWFFQWIFHWVTYNGHPNPAWSVGLASAVFGALACGILSMLISRSGADMLRSMKDMAIGSRTENNVCFVAGVTGGLLLCFSPVLWSQSTIVEVYSLNAFFQAIILLLLYRWMMRPREDATLWAMAFLFGLGITNHQTLLIMGAALAAGVIFSCIREHTARLLIDFVIVGLALLGMLFFCSFSAQHGIKSLSWHSGPFGTNSFGFWFHILFLIGIPLAGLFLPRGKTVCLTFLMVFLGISFYFYLPFASEQNPPMNWAYPRTWEGFLHAITRGQYERISLSQNLMRTLKDPGFFLQQINAIITYPFGIVSVVAQFSWPIALLALVPLAFLHRINTRSLYWILTSFVGFFFLTVFFILLQFPKLDTQTLFIMRVQYIQAHAIYAMWIAYGILLGTAFLEDVTDREKLTAFVCCGLALLLPLVPILRNWLEDTYIEQGCCEQNGHDFGWQFGYYQLMGAKGILEELSKEERKTYPNHAYPPEMGTNAIFYGGTDPGRFVPTYMIYSAKVRQDVFLITQNALADNTYMNVMRDLMGDDIWIPSPNDSNFAFKQYVGDIQSGKIPAGADVNIKDGRVSVQGVGGVMKINGILAKLIFDHNKYNQKPEIQKAIANGEDPATLNVTVRDVKGRKRAVRDFYVEESYVIPWMYPYLEPHGLIMKINPEPINLTKDIIKNDHDFWTWYTARLLNNPNFHRDVVARKTFSKLRSALAGLYAARGNMPEAEYAFQQAIDLYPLSPEANFRLADIYMRQFKFEAALKTMETLLAKDQGNVKVGEFVDKIKETIVVNNERIQIENKLRQKQTPTSVDEVIKLAQIYLRMGQMPNFERLTREILNQQHLPPQKYLEIAQIYAQIKRMDLMEYALQRYVQRQPNNASIWFKLAVTKAVLKKNKEAMEILKKAIQMGGPPILNMARQEQGFNILRQDPEFHKIVPPAPAPGVYPGTFPMPLNLPQ